VVASLVFGLVGRLAKIYKGTREVRGEVLLFHYVQEGVLEGIWKYLQKKIRLLNGI